MPISVTAKQHHIRDKAFEAEQRLDNAVKAAQKHQQVPTDQHGKIEMMNALLMAIAALDTLRQTTEQITQRKSDQIDTLTKQMNDLNNLIAGMAQFAQVDPSSWSDDLSLTQAITNVDTVNQGVEARISVFQARYGNEKLEAQQQESDVSASVNNVVQLLQQTAGIVNQIGQLSNVICGR